MAVCEICGCKTDELDFIQGSVNGLSKKMCSFCDKQLKAMGDSPNEVQLRWLNAVVSKEVAERNGDTAAALSEILKKHSDSKVFEDSPAGAPAAEKAIPKKQKGKVSAENVDKDELVLELLGRVEKLEKALITMKRKEIIKTIIEIIMPIILGILILIIFFSSGLFDALSGLYGEFI